MKCISRGLLSDLVLVRMHGRAESYLAASPAGRAAIALACRREATVPDLAERILSRTIYAQAATRVGPLRELLQNALDASSRGARIDVRMAERGTELTIRDRGRGMTREEVVHDLLVPFRSGKEGEPEVIGEHGIGFFSALELAPNVEIVTVTQSDALRLEIEPVGPGPHHRDFLWTLWTHEPDEPRVTGTMVRLRPPVPLPSPLVSAEIAAAARLVDPHVARIFVNDVLANTARTRMRRVARAAIDLAGTPLGDVVLYLGRGEAVEPEWAITQGGLLVTVRQDAFAGVELGLHRDLVRAIVTAGYGVVAELPVGVPLNKGRSAVAAHARAVVDRAIVRAFERFVLEDALYNRELLRAVDHRLSTVLDRLVHGALAGEPPAPPEPAVDEMAPTLRRRPLSVEAAPPVMPQEQARQPTVAAPEEVVRFAAMLIDAPAFTIVRFDADQREVRQAETLRGVLLAHRSGVLRRYGDGSTAGLSYLAVGDPLAEALWRRLAPSADAAEAAFATASPSQRASPPILQRIGRIELLSTAGALPGVGALAAAMWVLERIDVAISESSDLPPSPIAVHQALYGPDEMAHTDGSGISVNLASHRVRALLVAVLGEGDVAAFSALVDLLLHEKTHVSLASYVPRATAEHGTTFYRRKDLLRRRLLEALASGAITDPVTCLPAARHGLTSVRLPSPEALAAALGESQRQAA